MVTVRVKKVFLDKNSEELEPEVCPECLRIGQKSFLRYFFISLEESIYKCGSSKCMYPFVNFKYKSAQDQSVYQYQQIVTKPATKLPQPPIPAKMIGDISLDIDWLESSSSLYDTVMASDAVADEYSLNDSSVLTNFMNLSDDNVLDNYNINEFINNICNERCDDEAAEQYIITELLLPPAIKTPPLQIPSTPTTPLKIPMPLKSTTPVNVTPKLTKCLQFIAEQQPVATTKPYNFKSFKRQKNKMKPSGDHSTTSSKPKVCKIQFPKTENCLNEERITVPTEQDLTVRNLLNNHKNYRPLDWIQSVQSISFKESKPEITVRPPKTCNKREKVIKREVKVKQTFNNSKLEIAARPPKRCNKKVKVIKREVKVKQEVKEVSIRAHYDSDETETPFRGFTKRELFCPLRKLNSLKKLEIALKRYEKSGNKRVL